MLSSWDVFGIVLFAVLTIGYHLRYAVTLTNNPIKLVKGRMFLYHHEGVRKMLETGRELELIHQNRNQTMATSFLASSSLIFVGVILNLLVNLDRVSDFFNVTDVAVMEYKIYLLLLIFGSAFLNFLLSLKKLMYFNLLITSDLAQIREYEKEDPICYISSYYNRSLYFFTMGMRSFYYSMVIITWFFNTFMFIAATLIVFFLVYIYLDHNLLGRIYPKMLHAQEED